MADFNVIGNKTVYCIHGHPNIVPFQQMIIKCGVCGNTFIVKFFGVVKDKNGNYVL